MNGCDSLRRKKICVVQPIKNAGRYQNFVKALLDEYEQCAVRYNDFGSSQPVDTNLLSKVRRKARTLLGSFRAIPPLIWCDVAFFSNMGISWPLFRIAVALRKEVVLDVYISEYQTLVESRKTYDEESARARRILNRERYRFSNADKAIFLCESEKRLYCDTVGVVPRACYIVPLSNPVRPRAELAFYRGRRPRPSFCWWGGEGNPLHGLDSIIKGLRLLEERGIDFDFTIIGACSERKGKPYFDSLLQEVGWTNKVKVIYNPGQEGLSDILQSSCDIGFGAMSLEPKAMNVITNKGIDCANMGIPLITVRSKGMEEYFSDEEVYYCDEVSPEAICRCAERVIADQNVFERVEAAKEVFENNFSIHAQERKLVSLLEVGKDRAS